MTTYPRNVDLAYWINEREAMRQRRAAGMPAPWGYDPHMTNVRYCNVHREHDKVTVYIRNSGVYSGGTVPVWVVVLARMVNRISSLEALKPHVLAQDLDAVKATLKLLRGQDRTIWGNAYTISTCGKSMDKVDYVIDHVVRAVKQPLFVWDSLASAHAQLMQVDGLGSFLAAQVVADLKNTPQHGLKTASDWATWCAQGPGSLKGLTAYFGRSITPANFNAAIARCYQQTLPLVAPYVGELHMQDFQNCLCEFSKYCRVSEGGKARNNYDPFNKS